MSKSRDHREQLIKGLALSFYSPTAPPPPLPPHPLHPCQTKRSCTQPHCRLTCGITHTSLASALGGDQVPIPHRQFPTTFKVTCSLWERERDRGREGGVCSPGCAARLSGWSFHQSGIRLASPISAPHHTCLRGHTTHGPQSPPGTSLSEKITCLGGRDLHSCSDCAPVSMRRSPSRDSLSPEARGRHGALGANPCSVSYCVTLVKVFNLTECQFPVI